MKRRTTATGHFAFYAEKAVANGYSVVPYLPRTKRPRYKNWTTACFKPTDAVWLHKHMHKHPDDTVAIGCGSRVIAIDIDVEDATTADRIHEIARQTLGDTPLVRYGRAPRRALLYGVEGEIASKNFGLVEILGTYRAMVAFGIHPDTGVQYRWQGASPADTPVEKLPTVSADALERFAMSVCDVLGHAARRVTRAANDNVPSPAKAARRATHGESLPGRGQIGLDGKVIDGREAFLTHITCREYHRGSDTADELAGRAWSIFVAGSDITRPKGSGRTHWSYRDALAKAKAIMRKSPPRRRGRVSAGHHPARALHSYRRPGYWTDDRKALHDQEAARRALPPSALIVNRAMLAAVPLTAGQCEITVPELSKRTGLSISTVKAARAQLLAVTLWIAERGVWVPAPVGQALTKRSA